MLPDLLLFPTGHSSVCVWEKEIVFLLPKEMHQVGLFHEREGREREMISKSSPSPFPSRPISFPLLCQKGSTGWKRNTAPIPWWMGIFITARFRTANQVKNENNNKKWRTEWNENKSKLCKGGIRKKKKPFGKQWNVAIFLVYIKERMDATRLGGTSIT